MMGWEGEEKGLSFALEGVMSQVGADGQGSKGRVARMTLGSF